MNPQKARKTLLIPLMVLNLFACTTSKEDPIEPFNRASHELIKGFDQVILRPVATGYDKVAPNEIQTRIGYASNNLREPVNFANHLLQGDVHAAVGNLSRFLFNSIFGVAGFWDPATALGAPNDPTGLDETLALWKVPPGPYIELPFYGPKTLRSLVGTLGDQYASPLGRYFVGFDDSKIPYFQALSQINDRARYSNLIEMLLYQSADSYTASKQAYLQNQAYRDSLIRPGNQEDTEPAEGTTELEDFYGNYE